MLTISWSSCVLFNNHVFSLEERSFGQMEFVLEKQTFHKNSLIGPSIYLVKGIPISLSKRIPPVVPEVLLMTLYWTTQVACKNTRVTRILGEIKIVK